MAFSKKTWKDRISQYINRRLLTDSDGNTQQVTVTRDEGSVTEAGDAFSASNMNDLEDRIEDAFDGLTAADIPYSQGVSVADKLDALSEIGEIKTSAWTANSASSYGTNLTDSISVTKGVWIISASFPNCSVSFSAYINGISTNSDVSDQFESILIGGSSAKMSMIVKFSGNSSLQLRAAGSTSVTFSDITRGYLKAVKVAP